MGGVVEPREAMGELDGDFGEKFAYYGIFSAEGKRILTVTQHTCNLSKAILAHGAADYRMHEDVQIETVPEVLSPVPSHM